jgi:hypothetical protein
MKVRTGDIFFGLCNDFGGHLIALGTGHYITHCGIFVWLQPVGDSLKIVENETVDSFLTIFHITKNKKPNLLYALRKDNSSLKMTISNGTVCEPFEKIRSQYLNGYFRSTQVSFEEISLNLKILMQNFEKIGYNNDIRSLLNFSLGCSCGPSYGFSCSHLVSLYLLMLGKYNSSLFILPKPIDTISPGDLYSCNTPLLSDKIMTYYCKDSSDNIFIFSEKIIIFIFLILLVVIFACIPIFNSINKMVTVTIFY